MRVGSGRDEEKSRQKRNHKKSLEAEENVQMLFQVQWEGFGSRGTM